MRGLYVNTSVEQVAQTIDFFAQHNHQLSDTVAGVDVTMVYSRYDWKAEPVYTVPEALGGGKIFCHGWFIFNGERNNLTALAEAYLHDSHAVFDKIPFGVFVIAHINGNGETKIVSDTFGVSTHFVRCESGKIELAPTVKAFRNLPKPDEALLATVKAQGHLFGNFTAYPGIERMDAGAVLADDGTLSKYVRFDFTRSDPALLSSIPELTGKMIEHWPLEDRTLPLSGGMDSRLALTHQRFAFGYTYGPESSGDRPVARQYQDCFERYYEFEFSEPQTLDNEKALTDTFFFGVAVAVPRLPTVYYHTFEKAQGSYALFDGYLGDVVQRANYIKYGGPMGSILKLFPWLYHLRFSVRSILRRRYKALTDEVFERLMADYHRHTDHLELDDYQKITYYEFIYGRGGRYAVSGGNIVAGQCYTIVPFFLIRESFDILISQRYVDTVQYRQVGRIWSKAADRFRKPLSDSGISPMTPYWLVPFINIFYRIRLHYLPGFGSYAIGKAKKR